MKYSRILKFSLFFILTVALIPASFLHVSDDGISEFGYPTVAFGAVEITGQVERFESSEREYLGAGQYKHTFGKTTYLVDSNGDYKPYLISTTPTQIHVDSYVTPLSFNKVDGTKTIYELGTRISQNPDEFIGKQYWSVVTNSGSGWNLYDILQLPFDYSTQKVGEDRELEINRYHAKAKFTELTTLQGDGSLTKPVLTLVNNGQAVAEIPEESFINGTGHTVITQEQVDAIPKGFENLKVSFADVWENVSGIKGISFNGTSLKGSDLAQKFPVDTPINILKAEILQKAIKFETLAGNTFIYDTTLGYTDLVALQVTRNADKTADIVWVYGKPTNISLGDTITLDPEMGFTPSIDQSLEGKVTAGTACTTRTYFGTATVFYLQYDSTVCRIPYFKYDISSIPSGVVVQSASWEYDITGVNNSPAIDCVMRDLATEPANGQTTYDESQSGTVISTADSNCHTVADNYDMAVNSAGVTAIQENIDDSSGWYGFSWFYESEPSPTTSWITTRESDAVLSITYVTPTTPDTTTMLSATSTNATAIDLSWNAPSNLDTSAQPAINGYRVWNHTSAYINTSLISHNGTQDISNSTKFGAIPTDTSDFVFQSGFEALVVDLDANVNFSTNSGTATSDATPMSYNSGNGNVDVDADRDGSNNTFVIDLQHADFLNGNALSSIFVATFEFTVTSVTQGGDTILYMGFSDSDETEGQTSAQDFWGYHIQNVGGSQYGIDQQTQDGATLDNAVSSENYLITATTYYAKITNDGDDTGDVTISRNSDFSSPDVELALSQSGVTALDHFKMTTHGSSSANGDLQMTVDNLKIWDGTTTIGSDSTDSIIYDYSGDGTTGNDDHLTITNFVTPVTPTFNDDFDTDDWTDDASNTRMIVDTVGETFDFDLVAVSDHDASVIDLGGIVCVTTCAMRMDFTLDTFSDTTGGGDRRGYFGLFEEDETATTAGAEDGIYFLTLNQGAVSDWRFHINADSSVRTGNTMVQMVEDDDFIQGTEYGLEFIRTSVTTGTANIYTDFTYTTVWKTIDFVPTSGIDGLRYIKFMSDIGSDGTGGSFDGTIDNVKFYEGVTSIADVSGTSTIESSLQNTGYGNSLELVSSNLNGTAIVTGTDDYEVSFQIDSLNATAVTDNFILLAEDSGSEILFQTTCESGAVTKAKIELSNSTYTNPLCSFSTDETTIDESGNTGNDSHLKGYSPQEQFNCIDVDTGSALIGLDIHEISFWIKIFAGSPTGTATVGHYNTGQTLQTSLGTLDVSTVTSSYAKYTFNNGNTISNVVDTDKLCIYWNGGDASNKLYLDASSTDGYDGTATVRAVNSDATWIPYTDDLRFEMKHSQTTTATLPPQVISFTFDGTTKDMYINGTKQSGGDADTTTLGTVTGTTFINSDTSLANSQTLRIGDMYIATGTDTFSEDRVELFGKRITPMTVFNANTTSTATELGVELSAYTKFCGAVDSGNSVGFNGIHSNILCARTWLPQPQTLTATATGETTVALVWTAPINGTVTEYQILQDNVVVTNATGDTLLSSTVTGLTGSTLYSFTVKAWGELSGELSLVSDADTATTDAGDGGSSGGSSGPSSGGSQTTSDPDTADTTLSIVSLFTDTNLIRFDSINEFTFNMEWTTSNDLEIIDIIPDLSNAPGFDLVPQEFGPGIFLLGTDGATEETPSKGKIKYSVASPKKECEGSTTTPGCVNPGLFTIPVQVVALDGITEIRKTVQLKFDLTGEFEFGLIVIAIVGAIVLTSGVAHALHKRGKHSSSNSSSTGKKKAVHQSIHHKSARKQ